MVSIRLTPSPPLVSNGQHSAYPPSPLRQQWSAFAIPPPAADVICEQPLTRDLPKQEKEYICQRCTACSTLHPPQSRPWSMWRIQWPFQSLCIGKDRRKANHTICNSHSQAVTVISECTHGYLWQTVWFQVLSSLNAISHKSGCKGSHPLKKTTVLWKFFTKGGGSARFHTLIQKFKGSKWHILGQNRMLWCVW